MIPQLFTNTSRDTPPWEPWLVLHRKSNYYKFEINHKATERHMHYLWDGPISVMETVVSADVSIWQLSSLSFSLYSELKLRPSVVTTTDISTQLYCSNNRKTSVRLCLDSSTVRRPKRSDLRKTNGICSCLISLCFWGSTEWMCAQYLILLPPCKRVGDADDACNIKASIEWIFTGQCKAGGINKTLGRCLQEKGISAKMKVFADSVLTDTSLYLAPPVCTNWKNLQFFMAKAEFVTVSDGKSTSGKT